MKKEEAIEKAIEKAQNECNLLFYPVVCEATVIDGVEEISSALDNYQKKLAEHTDMWIICEMAKRWMEYLREKKESKKTASDIIDWDNIGEVILCCKMGYTLADEAMKQIIEIYDGEEASE